MTFTVMLRRATEEIRWRVRNGEVTERGLARLAGLSQPHVHNVLKGVRLPSPESADRLLRALGLRAADLLPVCPGAYQCSMCSRRFGTIPGERASTLLALEHPPARSQLRPRD